MSPTKSIPANVQIAIPTLLQRQVTIHRDKTTENVSLMPLSMLVLESARRYLADQKAFGTSSKTLDAALKPTFAKVFATEEHKLAANAGFAVYEKLADQIPTTVASKKLRAYCGAIPSQTPLQSVLEELSHTEGLFFTALEGPAGVLPVSECTRLASVALDGIECKNPEEQQTWKTREVCIDIPYVGKKCTTIKNPLFEAIGSGDEIYFTTFGAIFSTKGYLEQTSNVSSVTEHVGTVTGHVKKLTIPGNLKYPVYYELNQTTHPMLSLPPYYVYYSFTLFEKEYSDEERRQALADAARDATQAVISLLTADWIGVGINIAQLLYDLAVALDDDDVLGSCAFRFDDICQMPLGKTDTTVTFRDTHLLNEYKYVVSSHFALEGLP